MCLLFYFKILLIWSSLITNEFEHIFLSHYISHLDFLFVKYILMFSIHFSLIVQTVFFIFTCRSSLFILYATRYMGYKCLFQFCD